MSGDRDERLRAAIGRALEYVRPALRVVQLPGELGGLSETDDGPVTLVADIAPTPRSTAGLALHLGRMLRSRADHLTALAMQLEALASEPA